MSTEERLGTLERRFGRGLYIVVFSVLVGLAALVITLVVVRTTSARIQSQNNVIRSQNTTILQLVRDVKAVAEGQATILSLVQKQQEEEARAGEIRKEQLDRLTELTKGMKDIVARTEVIARQVPDCFKPPNGDCVKASARSLEQIRKDQQALLERTTFVVTNPAKPGETPLKITPIISPAPCQPALGIGNVGVAPGVACVVP